MKRKFKKTLQSPKTKQKKNIPEISSLEEDAMLTSPKKNSKSSIKSQTPKSKGKNLLSNSDQKSSRSKSRKNSTTTSLSKPPSENTSIHSPPHFSQNDEIQSNIDEKSLNSLLIQITKNLHFEQYKIKPKKVTNPINSRQNKFEQFTHFQYDFSLYKSIDIEIVSQIPKREQKHKYDDYKEKCFKFFTDKNKFSYYEFSNTKNNTPYGMSQIDQIPFEPLFRQNFQVFFEQNKIKNKIEMLNKLRRINFISAMNSLYSNFVEENNYFYIITPMHCFFFNLSQKRGDGNTHNCRSNSVVLSNTLRIDKILKDNEINYTKIKREEMKDGEEESNFNENPATINYFYMTHFFNTFLNEYEDKTFNVFSPFQFDESVFKRCKITCKSLEKKEQNVIHIQIYGCIFQEDLKKIINYLENKDNHSQLSNYSFSMKLTKIPTTNSYYLLNENLKHSIEKVEYKDNCYYIK